MRPKLIIFDVDGLLLDTEIRWQQAWFEVGKRHDIPDFATKTFLKCVGKSGKIVEDIVKADLPEYDNAVAILNEARKRGMELLAEEINLKAGVKPLLQKITTLGIPKAVATTTTRKLTLERLARVGILDTFDYLLCGDEVINRKPNPEIYLKVLDYFAEKPENALVLEDSSVGVEAAFRAKIPCIMVPDLIAPQAKQQMQTKAIVKSLNDVLAYLK